MKWNGLRFAVAATAVWLAVAPATFGQDEQAGGEADEPSTTAQPAEVPEVPAEELASADAETKTKRPFALYAEVAGGTSSSDDIPIPIETLSIVTANNTLSFDDQPHARAAIGWKLPHGKGDFRVSFDGYSEDGYTLEGTGRQAALAEGSTSVDIRGNLRWWTTSIEGGQLTSERTPPEWDFSDDANGNSFVDPDEVRYPTVDRLIETTVTDDLQNRAQHIDLVYGRVFGKRVYTARWWAGLRYFVYEGSLPMTAWLKSTGIGEGWTDGALVRPVVFRQETSGLGPTMALESQFNLADERIQCFLAGQATFIVLSLDADSGDFLTLVESDGNDLTAPARLVDSRTKSTWQTGLHAGARYLFRSGVTIEVSYQIEGFLDSFLIPSTIRVPERVNEVSQGTSALFRTEDYVLSGWRAGVAFQF